MYLRHCSPWLHFLAVVAIGNFIALLAEIVMIVARFPHLRFALSPLMYLLRSIFFFFSSYLRELESTMYHLFIFTCMINIISKFINLIGLFLMFSYLTYLIFQLHIIVYLYSVCVVGDKVSSDVLSLQIELVCSYLECGFMYIAFCSMRVHVTCIFSLCSVTFSIFIKRISGKTLRLDVTSFDSIQSILLQMVDYSQPNGTCKLICLMVSAS